MKRFISFFLCLIFYGCLTLKPISPPTPTPPDPLKYRLFITFIKLYTPTEITEVPDEDRGFFPDKIISYTTMEKMYISNYEPNKKKASPDDDQFDVKVTDPSGNTVDGTTKTGKKWSTYVVDVEESSITTQGKNWVGDLIDKNTFNGFTVNQTYHIVLTFKYNKAETSIKIPVQRNESINPFVGYIGYVSYKSGTLNNKTIINPKGDNVTETVLFGYLNSLHMSNVGSQKHLPDDGKFKVQVFDETTKTTVQDTGTRYAWAVYVPTTIPADSDNESDWVQHGLFDPTTLEMDHNYDLKLIFPYNGKEVTVSIPMKLEKTSEPASSQGVWVPNFIHNVILSTPYTVIETISNDGHTFNPDSSIPFDKMQEMGIRGPGAPAFSNTLRDSEAPDNGKVNIYVLDGNNKLMQTPIKDVNWTNAVCVQYGCKSVNWVSDNNWLNQDAFQKFTPGTTYYIYIVFTYKGQLSHIQIPVHRTGK